MLQIDKIVISAFRGIPGEVPLNLSAPLTLLYAPNGIGKTTVCDAIEWVLTGQVERLPPPLDEFFRCRNPQSDARTFVRAEVAKDDQRMQIARTLGDDPTVETLGDPTAKFVGSSALFDRIAPKIASDYTSSAARIARRRAWIVGTHFLSSERLSRLIDSNGRERRAELFADLLGVGHLQRLALRFDKVVAAAEKQRSDFEQKTKESRNQLSELQSRLHRSGAVVDQASALEAIKDAALGLAIPISQSFDLSTDTSRELR